MTLIYVIVFIFHPFWCYFFIGYLDWEVAGVAIACCVSLYTIAIISTLYIHNLNDIPNITFSISITSFNNLWDYFRLTILPTTFSICSYFWIVDIFSIILLFVDIKEYTIHLTISSIYFVFSNILYCYNKSTVTLIGLYTGKFESENIKKLIKVSLILSQIISVYVIVFCFLKNKFNLFNDTNVDNIYMGILLILFIFNCIQLNLNSVLRGLGKQLDAAIISFISYYVIGLSIAILFVFNLNMYTQGIWISLLISFFVNCFMYGLMLSFYDQNEIREETIKRLQIKIFKEKEI
jgi:MATE family multidrug resistance protein